MGRPTVVFPLVLLALLALLTFWIDRSVQPPERRPDANLRHDPDYILDNFVTTRTNVNGALAYVLAAVKMKHYPDDDTTELERPRFTQYAVNKPYTQIEGQRGNVSSDGETVEFMDNVVVVRQASKDKGEMTVRTQYLKMFPKQEVAVTDKPVVITQAPETVIHANGMVFNKKNQTVNLRGRVRTHYLPPSATKKAASKAPASAPAKASKAAPQKKAKATASPAKKQATQDKRTTSTNNQARIRRKYDNPAAP